MVTDILPNMTFSWICNSTTTPTTVRRGSRPEAAGQVRPRAMYTEKDTGEQYGGINGGFMYVRTPPVDVNKRELREHKLPHYKNLTPSRTADTGEMFHEDDGKDVAPLLRHDDLSVLATVSSCYDVST